MFVALTCNVITRYYTQNVQVETVEAQSRAALEECKKLEQSLAMSNKDKQGMEKKATQVG